MHFTTPSKLGVSLLSSGLILAATSALAAPAGPPEANTGDKAERVAAAKARADKLREAAAADYKSARARCDAKKGNDKDVCIKVAKAFLADARASAEARAKAAR